MYDVTAPAVYMHETVAANALYRERVNRVVAALKKPVTPIVYTDDQLPDLVLKNALLARRGTPSTGSSGWRIGSALHLAFGIAFGQWFSSLFK